MEINELSNLQAENALLKRQLFAYKKLVESLEARLTITQNELAQLKNITNKELLESERKANAILTEELEKCQAHLAELKKHHNGCIPLSKDGMHVFVEGVGSVPLDFSEWQK